MGKNLGTFSLTNSSGTSFSISIPIIHTSGTLTLGSNVSSNLSSNQHGSELQPIVTKFNIDKEIEGLKKINKDASPELSTRLKYLITSVNGNKEAKDIRNFVDNYLLAKDSRALREYISSIVPGVKLEFTYSNDGYVEEGVTIPIGVTFLWPDAGI